jgi:hypothetical protein
MAPMTTSWIWMSSSVVCSASGLRNAAVHAHLHRKNDNKNKTGAVSKAVASVSETEDSADDDLMDFFSFLCCELACGLCTCALCLLRTP